MDRKPVLSEMIFAINNLIIFTIGTILASSLICFQERGWGKYKSLFARSTCQKCQKELNFLQLIPLVGWFMNRGHCQYCGAQLSMVYPLSELFGGLWALAGWHNIDAVMLGIGWSITGVICLLILCYDIAYKRIPDWLVVGVGFLGVGFHGEYLTAFLLGGVALAVRWGFSYIRKVEGLGLGDVKLMFALGLWLPLPALPAFLILAGLFGIAWAKVWQYRYQQPDFPFAPALLFSFIILFLFRVARFANSGILSLDFI